MTKQPNWIRLPGDSKPSNQRHLIVDNNKLSAQFAKKMLVDYSDSESESEQQKRSASPPPLSPPYKSGGLSALLPKPKGARKNTSEENGPKKFIVNLPKFKNDDPEDGPPAKKARVGCGSGLSAMLPAPKRSGAAAKNAPPPPPLPPPAWETKNSGSETIIQAGVGNSTPSGGKGFVSVASSTRFVPQSVARKPIQPASAFKKTGSIGDAARLAPVKPKVSLFGSGEWHPTEI